MFLNAGSGLITYKTMIVYEINELLFEINLRMHKSMNQLIRKRFFLIYSRHFFSSNALYGDIQLACLSPLYIVSRKQIRAYISDDFRTEFEQIHNETGI